MADLSVWPTDGAGPGGDGSVSSEARWRKMGRLWVPSGVDTSLLGIGAGVGALAPTLVAGPTINVAAGSCWLDGHYAELTAPASIPASASGLLVVRFTAAENHAELVYRDAATTCTQTAATWELPIARMLAGALQDIRWAVSGEIGVGGNAATVTITSAHTQASPIDVVNIPAVYCDGGLVDVILSAQLWGNASPATGYMYGRAWVDAAEAVAAPGQPSSLPLACNYGTTYGTLRGSTRIQPAAGVHQIRCRAYGTAGVTSGAANNTHLRVVRV